MQPNKTLQSAPNSSVTNTSTPSKKSSEQATPSPHKSEDNCVKYQSSTNEDAGCLSPSGSIVATVDSVTLDTTGAHVKCVQNGARLEVQVDTPKSLGDQGYWSTLWVGESGIDVLDIGLGYGAEINPKTGEANQATWNKEASDPKEHFSATRQGNKISITGQVRRYNSYGEESEPATYKNASLIVTCP
ncbi:hypothetical protein KRX54_00095 [Actinomycetaceae bacterium TAE3-ERU4]|nr:hypothetical protein [Actinomycetaceae bacterium TAE3-ERU4]